jgi:integrase
VHFTKERDRHGEQAITAEEHRWVAVLRSELGDDIDQLREVIEFWRKAGRQLKPISASAAVEHFLNFRAGDDLEQATRNDMAGRLHAFATHFADMNLHEITPQQMEVYLRTYHEGWNRKSHHKRLVNLWKYAKRWRWVRESVFDELEIPQTPASERLVYSAAEFKKMIDEAFWEDQDVLLFVCLSGLAFMRSQELVRRFGNEPVLEWSHFLWDRNLIRVPEGAAKSTRRKSGNERFVPIHPNLREIIYHLFESSRKHSPGDDRVIKSSVRHFRARLHKIHQGAGVPFIDNGWRKSAISHWLSSHEYGVQQVAEWCGGSEASVRQYYYRALTPEDSAAWFAATGPG